MNGSTGLSRRVAKNATILSGFNALGVVAALGVDVLIAAFFGLGAATDAFFLAYTIPQFLRFVLTGSFQATLIPVFSAEARTNDGDPALWRLFRLIGTLTGVGLVGVSVLGCVLAVPLLRVVGSGLPAGDRLLAAGLARILFFVLPGLGLSEVMRSVLIARDHYMASSAGNLVNFIVILAVTATLGQRMGIQAVAWAYLTGAVAQTIWLTGAVLLAGGSIRPAWDPADPGLREALGLVGERMGGIALRRSGTVFERFVASFLPVGSVTALTYGQRVSLSLWQIFANSVSTAVLPDLSAAAQQGLVVQVRKGLAVGFKLLSFVIWPAATGLAVLSLPVVRLLFQRGAFNAVAATQIAGLVRVYAFSIPALALVQIFLAPHYAQKDARTPTVHMAVILGVNVLLVSTLAWQFGVTGLAWAYTLSALVSLVRSYWVAGRKLGSLGDLGLLGYSGLVGLACLGMAVIVGAGAWLTTRLEGAASDLWLLVELVVLSGLGILAYAAITHLLGMQEFSQLINLVRRRLLNSANESAPIS